MNNLFKKTSFVIVFMLIIASLFTACNLHANTEDTPVITIECYDGDVLLQSLPYKDLKSYIPEKDGYDFDGWFKDQECTIKLEGAITSNSTLYVKWKIKTFTVTFVDKDGNTLLYNNQPSQQINYGEAATAPTAPTLDNYIFTGWDKDFNEVKSNLTVNALYSAKPITVNFYIDDEKFTFNNVDSLQSDSLIFNTMSEEIKDYIPSGFSFKNWNEINRVTTDKDITIDYSPVFEVADITSFSISSDKANYTYNDNVSLTANYTKYDNIEYTVNWYENDALIYTGDTLTIDTPDAKDYTYKAILTASALNSTKQTQDEKSLTVEKATLNNINVSDINCSYSASFIDAPIMQNTLDTDKITYIYNGIESASMPEIKNAGDYTIDVKIERENYNPFTTSFKATINKKLLTVTVSNKNVTYGDSIPTNFDYTINGYAGDDTINDINIEKGKFTCSAENTRTIQTATIKLDGFEADNYDFIYQDGALTINKANLTINLEDASMTYGDKNPDFKYNYEGLKFEDALTCTISTEYNQSKGVGKYEINAEANNLSDKYNITINKATLTVNKRDLSVDIEPISLSYGANVPEDFALNFENAYFVPGENNTSLDLSKLSFSTTYTKISNVGEYIISATGINAKNYNVTINNGTLTVNKKSIKAKVNNCNTIYGNAAPAFTISSTELINNDSISCISVDFTCIYTTETNVGTYDITAKAVADNYDVTVEKGTLTVNKKNINVAIDNCEITYGDTPTFTISSNELVNNDDITCISIGSFTCNYLQDKQAQTYTISASNASSENYEIINIDNGRLIVNKKPITVSVSECSVTYGDTCPSSFEYTCSDKFAFEDNLSSLNISTSTNYVQYSPVGKYAISLSYNNDNYIVLYDTEYLTVNKKDATISYSKVALNKNTYFAINTSLVTTTGLVNGSSINGNIILEQTGIGTYSIENGPLSNDFKLGDNFNITYNNKDVTNCYNLIFNISITIADQQFEYDQTTINRTYDGSASTFEIFDVTLDTYEVWYSLNDIDYSKEPLSFTNATVQTVHFKIIDKAFDPCDEVKSSATVTINKAILSVVANSCSTTYATEAPELTFAITGFVASDDMSCITTLPQISCPTYAVGDGVGTYDINVSGAYSDNYDFNYTKGTLSVNKATLNVQPSAIAVYGNNMPSEYNLSYTGFVNGDTISCIDETRAIYNTNSFTSTSPVSTEGYEITVSNLFAENYTFNYVAGKIIVNKRPLTIKANNATISYGDNAPSYNVTYEGLTSTDNSSCITNLTINCLYEIYSNAGNYEISPSGAYADNYAISYESGTLTVNKKALTATMENNSVVFGNALPTFDYSISGFIGGDNSSLIQNVQYVSDYYIGANVGNYSVSMTSDNMQNYYLNVTPATLTVTKREVTIAGWEHNTTYTYTGENQIATVKPKYLTYDNSYAYATSAVITNEEFKNAGSYTLTAIMNNNNYSLAEASYIDLVINKANYVNITHPTLTGTYNPNTSLALGYTLNSGFTFINPSEIPTCVKTQYDVKYNGDPQNYNDYETFVTINLEKALCEVIQTLFENNANDTTYLIEARVSYNGTELSSALYDCVYSNGDQFVNAGTYKTVLTINSDNYKINPTGLYVKIKGVSIGNTFYTIEDAIKNSVSGNVMIVKYNTSFADSSFANEIYNDSSYYTIKTGTTLLVPYSDAYSDSQEDIQETSGFMNDSDPYSNPVAIGDIYRQLSIPQNINLTCYGTINVNARRGFSAWTYQGGTIENYGQLNISENANITVKSGGVINSNGFTVGKGTIVLESGAKAYDVLVLLMWQGGQVAKDSYKDLFISDQYLIQNIEAKTIAHAGSSIYGRYYIKTSYAIPVGSIEIMGGTNSVFNCTSGYCSKYFNKETGKLELEVAGNVITKSTQIKISFIFTINIDTKNVEFPIPGNMDLTIKSGSYIKFDTRFKFLPGANLFVEENATVEVTTNGKLFFFTKDLEVPFECPYYVNSYRTYGKDAARWYRKENGKVVQIFNYNKDMDATFTLNGILNIKGSFGGRVTTQSTAARITVESTAKLNDEIVYNLYVTEVKSLSCTYTTTKKPIPARLYLDGSSTAANMTTGTYTANESLTFTKTA